MPLCKLIDLDGYSYVQGHLWGNKTRRPDTKMLKELDTLFSKAEKNVCNLHGASLLGKRKFAFIRTRGPSAGYVTHYDDVGDFYYFNTLHFKEKFAEHEAAHRLQMTKQKEISGLSYKGVVEYLEEEFCNRIDANIPQIIAGIYESILAEAFAYYTVRAIGHDSDLTDYDPSYHDIYLPSDELNLDKLNTRIVENEKEGCEESDQANDIGDIIARKLHSAKVPLDKIHALLYDFDTTDKTHPLHDNRNRYIELCNLISSSQPFVSQQI